MNVDCILVFLPLFLFYRIGRGNTPRILLSDRDLGSFGA